MTKEQILKECGFDLSKAKATHAWLNEGNDQSATTVNEVVTAYTDENGKSWVHLCAGRFDFLLDIKNLSDGETWNDANKLCTENDMELTSKNRWELIQAFRPEVDQIIEDLGGEPLEDYLWAGDEYFGRNAWYFSATSGTLVYGNKMGTNGVVAPLLLRNPKSLTFALHP